MVKNKILYILISLLRIPDKDCFVTHQKWYTILHKLNERQNSIYSFNFEFGKVTEKISICIDQ